MFKENVKKCKKVIDIWTSITYNIPCVTKKRCIIFRGVAQLG